MIQNACFFDKCTYICSSEVPLALHAEFDSDPRQRDKSSAMKLSRFGFATLS